MNGLIMILLGILLIIKSTSTGGASMIQHGIPINSTYVIIANTNSSLILDLLNTQGGIKYAIMVVPKNQVKTLNVNTALNLIVGVEAQGYFPGTLEFINGTSYIGIYEGSLNGTTFIGDFVPIINVNGQGVPAYPVNPGPLGMNFTVTVRSEVPVVLRYYSFNDYDPLNYSLINSQTPIPIITGHPPITISMGSGVGCKTYIVYESFSQPIEAIPEPFVINFGESATLIVSNITLISTNPSSEVSILEPGDLIISNQPVLNAIFNITLCHISQEVNYNGTQTLYARYYLTPITINIPPRLIMNYLGSFNGTGLLLINELLHYLNNGRFKLSVRTYPLNYTLINGTGSLLDYALLSMDVLRIMGIPTRVTIGFAGRVIGHNTYIFYSGNTIVWDEAFVNSGWVAFEPITTHLHNNAIPITVILTSVLASLILMVPWLIGYYIYYYLGRRPGLLTRDREKSK